MIFSRGRILGLACTVAALVGAMVVLHEIARDDKLIGFEGVLRAEVLTALLLLYGCHFLAEPARWLVYFRQPSIATAPNRPHFSAIFATFNVSALLSYSLPFKLGLPLRLVLLSQFLRLDSVPALRLMVMDGAFNLLCWAGIAIALLFMLPEVTLLLLAHLQLPYLLLALAVLGLVAYGVLKWKGKQLWAAVSAISPGVAAVVVLTLMLDILLYGMRHALMAQALGLDVDASTVFIIGIVAVFAGIVSTLPMGLGAYDASLVGLLALYGVQPELGLLLAFGNRLGMILTSILLGLPSALVMLKKGAGLTEG